jgi:very-short-patch-repair endonuclease
LIIELDGGQHYSVEGQSKDQIRDDFISKLGIKILRFADREVFKNTKEVLERIWENLP